MNDRNKESLSALMDGEADELEVRRIINQLDSNDEIRSKWSNYHLMGSLMRDEGFDSIDLTQGINKELDGELGIVNDDDARVKREKSFTVKKTQKVWYKPLTSVAVAASVTLAVLLGVQSIEQNDNLGLAEVNSLQDQQGELTASVISTEEQQQLENAQQQLQDYILQYSADHNSKTEKGVLPFARIVEFQGQGK